MVLINSVYFRWAITVCIQTHWPQRSWQAIRVHPFHKWTRGLWRYVDFEYLNKRTESDASIWKKEEWSAEWRSGGVKSWLLSFIFQFLNEKSCSGNIISLIMFVLLTYTKIQLRIFTALHLWRCCCIKQSRRRRIYRDKGASFRSLFLLQWVCMLTGIFQLVPEA